MPYVLLARTIRDCPLPKTVENPLLLRQEMEMVRWAITMGLSIKRDSIILAELLSIGMGSYMLRTEIITELELFLEVRKLYSVYLLLFTQLLFSGPVT